MLNAIGLENVGIEAFISDKLPFLEKLATPVFINIYGKTVEEYSRLSARIDQLNGVAGVEVNISCPNVKAGGVAFGVDPEMVREVVAAVCRNTRKTVVVKLSPNVTDIAAIAQSAESAGADAISLINTITGMAIDVNTRQPKLANITGGLSGPAIKPVALRMVWQAAQSVSFPVIGIGGILSAEDALEFLIAGASAVQIGTANFIDPTATTDVVRGVEKYLIQRQITHLTDIIGSLTIP